MKSIYLNEDLDQKPFLGYPQKVDHIDMYQAQVILWCMLDETETTTHSNDELVHLAHLLTQATRLQ